MPSDAEIARITGVVADMVLVSTGKDRLFPIDDVGDLVQAVLDEEHGGSFDHLERVARAYDSGYAAALEEGEEKPTKDAIRQAVYRGLKERVSVRSLSGCVDGVMWALPEETWQHECDPTCSPAMNMYCSQECERRARRRKAGTR